MIALAIAMVFSMAACTQGQNTNTTTTTATTTTMSESKDTSTTTTTTTETTGMSSSTSSSDSSSETTTTTTQSQSNNEETTATSETTTASASDSSATTTTDASNADTTVGKTLVAEFQAIMQQEKAHTPLDIANDLLANKIIEFEGFAEEIEPGLLPGFNADIDGFQNGAVFAPIIGSIPFVGYVFQLEPGADIGAFTKKLTDHANPNWLVCVAADETVVETVGNTVLFIMCRSANQ